MLSFIYIFVTLSLVLDHTSFCTRHLSHLSPRNVRRVMFYSNQAEIAKVDSLKDLKGAIRRFKGSNKDK